MNAEDPDDDDLRPEYDLDFTKAVRGQYYQQYLDSSNVVVLEPDVAAAFWNVGAVNQALRAMLQFADQTSSLTGGSVGPQQRSAAGRWPRTECAGNRPDVVLQDMTQGSF